MVRLTKSGAEQAIKAGVPIKRTKHGIYLTDHYDDAC